MSGSSMLKKLKNRIKFDENQTKGKNIHAHNTDEEVRRKIARIDKELYKLTHSDKSCSCCSGRFNLIRNQYEAYKLLGNSKGGEAGTASWRNAKAMMQGLDVIEKQLSMGLCDRMSSKRLQRANRKILSIVSNIGAAGHSGHPSHSSH